MEITDRHRHFMQIAIDEARMGIDAGHGGPFGCVVVKGDEIMGKGHNRVLCTNDPTAHAEVVAIRDACSRLGHFQLTGCEVYCSCEPCPMCFGALYWARPDVIFYANTKHDAAAIGFDDAFIYEQLAIPQNEDCKIPLIHIPQTDARLLFQYWKGLPDKGLY